MRTVKPVKVAVHYDGYLRAYCEVPAAAWRNKDSNEVLWQVRDQCPGVLTRDDFSVMDEDGSEMRYIRDPWHDFVFVCYVQNICPIVLVDKLDYNHEHTFSSYKM